MIVLATACSKDNGTTPTTTGTHNGPKGDGDICGPDCPASIVEKIWYDENGRIRLWGGENENQHFDITNRNFDVDFLRHGLGREFFQALIEPEFISNDDPTLYTDNTEMIVLISDDELKAYPIQLLKSHEVINDEFNGQPIMVSYCILADYVGVHSREYCGHTFTFGVSGYTYSDGFTYDGRNGFILWDRDTESLWWPLQENSISGNMINTPMNQSIDFDYVRTDWKTLISDYPQARILKAGQNFTPPSSWPSFDTELCD